MKGKGNIQDLAVGKIIVAEPFLKDPYFEKSVVLIVDYHKTGTIGLILNQPVKMNIKRVIFDFPQSAAQMCFGGPVETNTVHYLHTAGKILNDAREVLPGLYWGGDFNQLKVLMKKGIITDHQIRFYVGYTGWAPNQLEQEMEESKAWLVANGHPNYVFNRLKGEELWQQVMKNKGSNFEIIADASKQVNLS